MIDAVVNSSADFLAKGKIQNSPAAEVNHAVSTETNSKTSKATEVQSQARAVNDKDKVTGTLVEEQKKGKNVCPRCGGELVKRNGKRGEFIGCSNFPKCRYTADSEEKG